VTDIGHDADKATRAHHLRGQPEQNPNQAIGSLEVDWEVDISDLLRMGITASFKPDDPAQSCRANMHLLDVTSCTAQHQPIQVDAECCRPYIVRYVTPPTPALQTLAMASCIPVQHSLCQALQHPQRWPHRRPQPTALISHPNPPLELPPRQQLYCQWS
jgi:hypothetical protein